MSLIDEYIEEYEKYIGKINKPYKISGNLFSHFLRGKILDIIKDQYEVSAINSYIKGCKIEWDLLIVDKAASKEEKRYNIYFPKNVICAFEFKSSGAIMSNDPDKAKEYLGNEIEKLKECSPKIKYGYISLCEIPANLNALKNEYENKCFWIIEGYYRNRNSKDIVVANEEKLKEYINGLLK